MKKIVITSKNPVKIQAVKNGFTKMFPEEKFEFLDILVPSNVADQPLSNDEAFMGAKNRARNGMEKIEADFYVGIEAGVEQIENEMEAFAWVYIQSGGRIGKSQTGTFFLPKKVIELLAQGKELGEADDIVFNYHNSKEQMGSVGILTGGAVERTGLYTEAVVLALIPFKNPDLY